MRIARFSYKDTPRYAFVQTDKQDGKDYLVELSGYPLTGQQVALHEALHLSHRP